jgi:hypothetical protein
MRNLEPVPEGVQLDRGEADLDVAAAQLRALPVPRVVEIADRVLERTLAAPRRAQLVRARPPHDHLEVSTLALTTLLRARLDESLVDAAVGRVLLDVSRDGRLEALTVELVVRYGTDVLVTADAARVLAREVLSGALGHAERSEDETVIELSHVHVSDVTVGDPHVVDPADERL